MNEQQIKRDFAKAFERDGERLKSDKSDAEYWFRQGFNHGFDHALTPENRVVNYADSITGPKAARAF